MKAMTKRLFLSVVSAVGFIGSFQGTQAGTSGREAPTMPDLSTFPYKVISVEGVKALEEWTRLRSLGEGWPVVIGGDEDLQAVVETLKYDDTKASHSVADIIKAAEALSLPKDLLVWQEVDGYGEIEETLGEWPETLPGDDLGLTVAEDILTNTPLPRVHIVLLPTDKSWEAPAYLRWGGWNSCPPPEYHVAMLSAWHRKFGAELAGLSGDVMNIRVTKPVVEKEQALALAKEQYLYCADIVDQGTNDISTLAATLMNQRWWFFWWD